MIIVIVYNDSLFPIVASTSTAVSSEPRMSDLANRVAAKIPEKWKQVAIQLELSISEIKTIRQDEDDAFDRFMAVFDRWQRSSCSPYAWKTLVSALKTTSVNEIKLAEELQREFC